MGLGGWFSHGLAAPIPFSQDLTTGLGWERREASGTSWKVLRTGEADDIYLRAPGRAHTRWGGGVHPYSQDDCSFPPPAPGEGAAAAQLLPKCHPISSP